MTPDEQIAVIQARARGEKIERTFYTTCGATWVAMPSEEDFDFQTREYRIAKPVPKGFIVVSKDLLAEAIACNTDASLVDARHIINSVLKVSDDEIFREVLKEQTK